MATEKNTAEGIHASSQRTSSKLEEACRQQSYVAERADVGDGSMFSVILVEPEIPPNTGNIGRLCLATRFRPSHLVKPLDFQSTIAP